VTAQWSSLGGGSPQWTAEQLQLINWGGFHGYNRIPLDADSTLISGGSGTGKSTMMDSYIALLMPHTVPFNGASNAAKGRARSEDQRSILSYMRGKTDTVEDRETGETKDHVLRGDGISVASCIAVTFRSESGARFTAARLMFAKATAVRDTEVVKKWVTIPDRLDLESVYEFAAQQFPTIPMKTRYPGMQSYDSYDSYAHALFISLSIGSRGEGENALKLLSRIQSGQQEPTVDDLYKKLVLEPPATYDEAKKVVAHFDDLSQLYEELRRDQDQIDTLSDIKSQYGTYQEAQIAAALIASLGHTKPSDTTFALWASTVQSETLSAELEVLSTRQTAAAQAAAGAERAVQELEIRQTDLVDQIRNNGGEALTRLEQELKELQAQHGRAENLWTDFVTRIALLDTVPESGEDFSIMQGLADETLATIDKAKAGLEQKRRDAVTQGGILAAKIRELNADLTSLLERKGSRILRTLSERRDQLAHAAGLDRSDLPFIAELLDIHRDDEQWRTAAEAVMGGFARTVVLDRNLLDNFTNRIDKFPPQDRIHYQGVPLDMPDAAPAHPKTLAGKLIFKDGPFKGWLQKRVAELFDHECVDTPDELRNDGRRRVTPSGQERHRARGAHGVPQRRNYVIGFSNEELIAELQSEIADLTEQVGEHLGAERAASTEIDRLDGLRRAHEEVLRTEWADIDVAAVAAKIESNERQQAQILAAENILAALRAQKADVDRDLEDARFRKVECVLARNKINEAIDTLTPRQTSAAANRQRLIVIGVGQVTDSHADVLAPLLADAYTGDVNYLDTAIGKVRLRLSEQLTRHDERADTARTAIEKAFRNFKSRWDNYDWGTDIESYRDYCDHLDALESTGLAAHRDEFAQKVARWSGADLVELRRAFRNSKDNIQTRLDAVNRILEDIPFGAKKDRLQIKLKHHTNQLIKRFTAEMEEFASAATDMEADDLSTEQIDLRYRAIETFIKYLLPADRLPKGVLSTRDELLDVRRHVGIIAERVDKDTKDPLSTYNSLGGKSGGETQELMAFIVGAALRYQLGDESRARPRFAPVLLDEGFIKADSQFAGRAVEAWRKLGFQLIVGSVIDKVSAIEPYVSQILQVTKSPEGYSHVSVFAAAADDTDTQDAQHEVA
jgi:uncharacterized protein YPO0396